MSYQTSIKKLNEKLLNLINSVCANTDDVNLNKRLTKQSNSLNYASFQTQNDTSKKLENIHSTYSSIVVKSDKKKTEVNDNLKNELDIIINDYAQKREQEMLNNVETIKNIENEINQIEQDINYYNLTTIQTISVLEDEYEKTIERFNEQNQIAKLHYRQSVAQNNNDLEKKLSALDSNYETMLVDFDYEMKNLIETFKKVIEEKNQEYIQIKDKLTELKNEMKEKMLQESISLNDAIKILSAEKAKSIDEAKIKHNKKLEVFNQEKEKQHLELVQKMKNIQKDFVIALTSLEDTISEIKQKHNKLVDLETRKYHYQMLKLNRLQNIEMAPLNKDNFDTEEEEKQNKNQIKLKNRAFYQSAINIKKESNKSLRKLELSYQKDFEKNRYNKQILELKRNKAVKDITDTEQLKNKRFQEEDNIFNVDLKLAIDLANQKYTQKANIVKNQNQIKNNGLKKDLDLAESSLLKELEANTTKVQTIELEIEGCDTLSKLVHEYEEIKYLKTRQYYIVKTLLEIEKCKLLNDYNQIKYKQSIAKTQNDNTRDRLRLENDNRKFETINKLKSDLERKKIEKENILLGYNLNKMNILEESKKEIILRKNQFEIDTINQDALFSRFTREIKCAFIGISSFSMLIEQLNEYTPRLLKILLHNTKEAERKELAKTYVGIIVEYYTVLLDDLNAMQTDLVNKRMDFVEKFKYRHFYNSILLDYETKNKKLLTKKKQFEDTLENYNKTKDIFIRRSYSLKNESSMLIHRIKYQPTNKKAYKEKISKNKMTIKGINYKILDIDKSSRALEKELVVIEKQLIAYDKQYNRSVNNIKRIQTKNTKAYRNYKQSIQAFTARWKKIFNNFTSTSLYRLYEGKEGFKIDKFISTSVSTFDNINNHLSKKLYKLTNKFKNSANRANDNSVKQNRMRYETETKAIRRKGYRNLEALNKTHNINSTKNRNERTEISTKIHKMNNEFLKIERNLENDYELKNRYLVNDQKIELNNFYSNFSSLNDNLDEIVNTFNKEINYLDAQFILNKENNIKNRLREEEKLNQRLVDFVKLKDDLVDRLPTVLKYQTSLLNKQVRDRNQNITLDIRKNKNEAEVQKKNIIRNISIINESLDQQLFDNDRHLFRDINKEKKNHNFRIHRYNTELKKL